MHVQQAEWLAYYFLAGRSSSRVILPPAGTTPTDMPLNEVLYYSVFFFFLSRHDGVCQTAAAAADQEDHGAIEWPGDDAAGGVRKPRLRTRVAGGAVRWSIRVDHVTGAGVAALLVEHVRRPRDTGTWGHGDMGTWGQVRVSHRP